MRPRSCFRRAFFCSESLEFCFQVVVHYGELLYSSHRTRRHVWTLDTIVYGTSPGPVWCNKATEASVANRRGRVGAGRGCSTSPQDMPDALHFLVLTVAGWVNRPQDDQIAYLREEHRGLRASWPGGSVGPGVSVFGRVGPPSCHVCHDRWPARTVGWTRPAAHRQAVSGPRLPARGVPRALTRWCVARGGGAGRCAGWQGRPGGAAGWLAPPAPAAPDRRPAGLRRRAVPARG